MAVTKLDQDQLATFLGHDIRIHRHVYCQPLEIMQRAKVASILLKVNRGVQVHTESCDDSLADEEIEPDDGNGEDDLDDEGKAARSDVEDVDCGMEMAGKRGVAEGLEVSVQKMQVLVRTPPSKNKEQSAKCTPQSQKNSPHGRPERSVRQKKPWTPDEVAAVRKHLSQCIVLNKIPQKHEAERALTLEPSLRQRSWKILRLQLVEKEV